MKKRNVCDLLRCDCGASLVELALLLPLFAVLLFVAVDFGRAAYMAIEIAGAARAAATYGSRNPTDTLGMQSVAQGDAPDIADLTVGTPTYGCECSDGTGYSASCTTAPTCTGTTKVLRVNVTVTGIYSPLILPWPGLPATMTFTSSASMRSPGS